MDLRDIGIRALKTALQAGIAVLGVGLVTDVATYQAAGIAAAAAAISVVMNSVLSWANTP